MRKCFFLCCVEFVLCIKMATKTIAIGQKNNKSHTLPLSSSKLNYRNTKSCSWLRSKILRHLVNELLHFLKCVNFMPNTITFFMTKKTFSYWAYEKRHEIVSSLSNICNWKNIFSCKIRIGTHFFVVYGDCWCWKLYYIFMEAQNNLLDQIILRTVMITLPQ